MKGFNHFFYTTFSFEHFVTVLLVFCCSSAYTQTTLLVANFETDGLNYSTTGTATGSFGRFNSGNETGEGGTDDHTSFQAITGTQGSFYFFADNIGGAAQLNFSSIDLTGFNTLQVSMLLAAPGDTYDNTTDLLQVQYSIAGSPFVTLAQFAGEGNDSDFYSEDADTNGTGDGTNRLTAALTENTWTLDVSGSPDVTNVVVRIQMSSSAGNEDMVVDNVRLSGLDFTASSLSPTDGSTIPSPSNITITYPIVPSIGTGNITIQDIDAPSTLATLDVTSATEISIVSQTVTIDVSGLTFIDGNSIEVNVPAGAFTDGAIGLSTPIFGFSDWSFTINNPASITSVTPPADDLYANTDPLDFTVTFDEPVTITGNPRIAVNLNTGGAEFATFQTGTSPGTAHIFRYTVDNNDLDTDGIVLISPLQLNGGTIEDGGSNAAALAYAVPNTSAITVDGIAPTGYSVTIDQPFINASNSTALSFTFSGAEIGADYNYSIDDSDGGTTAITGSGTITTATDQITTIDVSTLADENLVLTVFLTDPAGNQGGNVTDNVDKDVIPPTGYTVSIDQVNITSANQNSLSFTFAGAETGTNYSYSIDDTDGGTSPVTGSGSVSSANQQISGINVSTLTDGNLTLTVFLTDDAGNQGGNTTDNVNKDVVPPNVSIGAPSLTLANSTSTVDFLISYSGATSISLVASQVNLEDGGDGITANINIINPTATTRTVRLTNINGDGTLTISLDAGTSSDNVGNDDTGAGPGTLFTVDNTGISSNATFTASEVNNGDNQVITVTFGEVVTGTPTLSLNGSSSGPLVNNALMSGAGNTWTFNAGIVWPGDETITVTVGSATDIIGNPIVTNPTNNTFEVDNTAPVPPSVPDLAAGSDSFGNETNSNGTNFDDVTNDTTPTFNGTAEAGSTVEIRSSLTGTIIGTGVATGGTYNITTSLLPDGVHSITARATDPLGNIGGFSTGLSVTIDTQAPSISSNLTFADNGSNRETVIFSFDENIDLDNNTEPLGFSSSTGSIRNTSDYETGGNLVELVSTDNGDWTIATTFNYTNGIGNIKDLAGNELATQTALNTSDVTPPTLITGIQFLPNGNGQEQIIFNLSEEINIAEGSTVNGFYVNGLPMDNIGAFGEARYSSKAIDNTITLTSLFDGAWNDVASIEYRQGVDFVFGFPSNIFDISGNQLGNFIQSVQLRNVSLTSNNANNRLAKPADVVTLSFTASQPLDADPVITIAGNAPTTFINSAPNYTATYTFAGGETEGLVPFSITTLQGGLTTVVTNTTDSPSNPSNVTYDETAPLLDPISITSNNADPTRARPGDVVTIILTSDESIAASTILIAGLPPTTSTCPGSCGAGPQTFTRTMNGTEPEGIITFSFDVQDATGNMANFTATTDATSVDYDRTIPEIVQITRLDSDPHDAGINAGNVEFNIEFTEEVTNVDPTDFVVASSNLTAVPTIDPTITTTDNINYQVTLNNFDLLDSRPSGTIDLNLTGTSTIFDLSSNSFIGTLQNPDETYIIINPEPIEDIADLAGSANATSIDLTWTNSGTDQIAYQHLVLVREEGTPSSPSDTNPTADDLSLSTGTVGEMAFNISHGTSTLSVSGLNSATSYTFRIYPYTNDGSNIDYQLGAPDQITVETTTASETTITRINAAATISSLSLNQPTATNSFVFEVTDDGLNPNGDNVPTLITDLVVTQGTGNHPDFVDWTTIIGGAILIDDNGSTPLSGVIGTNTISFNSIPANIGTSTDLGHIPDATTGIPSSKLYTLQIFLVNPIDERGLDFELTVANVNVNSSDGSGISDGLGASPAFTTISSGAGNNIVDVTATEFVFMSPPPSPTIEGLNISLVNPSLIRAQDANGVRDFGIDEIFMASAGLLTSGTTEITAPINLDVVGTLEFIDGELDGSSIRYADTGDGTLTITDIAFRGISTAINTAADVIDTEVSEITTGITSNGLNLNTGQEDVVLLGFTLDATTATAGEPNLNSVTFRFRNQNPQAFNITDIYESGTFRIFRSNDNTIDVANPLSDDVLIGGLTVFEGTDFITISGFNEELDSDVVNQSFALVANVALTAQFAVTPSPIIQTFYTSDDIVNSSGSVSLNGGFSEFNGFIHQFEDNQFPLITSLSPVDGEPLTPNDNVNISSNLIIQFNEPMNASGFEVITIRKQEDSGFVLNLSNPTVSTDSTTFTFNPIDDLDENTNFFVQINSGVFFDKAGNTFAGINNTTDWNFKTSDATDPEFVLPSPLIAINPHDDGFELGVKIDEVGEVFYMIVTQGSDAPSRDDLFGVTTYSGTGTLIKPSTLINISIANEYQFDIVTGLNSANNYTVYAVARDNANPANDQGAIVDLDIDLSGAGSSNQTVLNNPNIEICVGDFQQILSPISIREGENNDFLTGSGQSIILALPAGFEINTLSTVASVETSGSNISNAILTFVNSSIFRINYDISGTSGDLDYIIIRDLEIKALSDGASGSIVRIGGTANNQDGNSDSDGLSHATINTTTTTIANFTFQLNGIPISTVANDEPSLNLVAEPSLLVEGLNEYSGDGVVGESFFIGSVGVGEHDVTLTHTTLQGCQLVGTETISVFDATSAVPGLDIQYCTGAATIATITEDGKQSQGFRLFSFVTDPSSTANVAAVQPSGSDFIIDIDLAGSPLASNPTGEGTVILKVIATYQSLTNSTIFEEFPIDVSISAPPVINSFVVEAGPRNPTDFCIDGTEIVFSGDYNEGIQNDAIHNFTFQGFVDSDNINDLITFSATTTNPAASISPQDVVDENGLGEYSLIWNIENPNTSCISSQNVTFTVNPLPEVSFNNESACLGFPTVFNNTTVLPDDDPTDPNEPIYRWDFDDLASGAPLSNDENPEHTFSGISFFDVSLEVETEKGCTQTISRNIQVGNNPSPNFSYQQIGVGVETEFTINEATLSILPTEVDTIIWSILDRGATVPTEIGQNNITSGLSIPFSTAGIKDVSLTIESLLGCATTITDSLFIVPIITLQNESNYTANFEGSDDGWVTWGTNNSWLITGSGGEVINGASPTGGSTFWVTGTNDYNENEESFVYSPIFNFNDLDRPLVTMDIFDNINQNDGAVLEYSLTGFGTTDNASTSWELVGRLESGINWYDQRDIANAAGLVNTTNVGWTEEEDDWKNARNTLRQVASRPTVQFRVSFKSGPNEGLNSDGFAFDNFFIGQRTRTVLVENFTNTNSNDPTTINFEADSLSSLAQSSDVGSELIVINYHTDFPRTNEINQDNPVDPSARALFYNIDQVPRAVVDGNIFQDDVFSIWGADSIDLRTLSLANFSINITSTTQDGILGINAEITPRIIDLEGENISIIAAVIENSVGDLDYVLRKLLPNAAGVRRATNELEQDVPFTIPFNWTPTNVSNLDDLSVVVFIQDEETKEVYQAEIVAIPELSPVTGVGEELAANFKMYPNPANKELTLEFSDEYLNSTFMMYDNFGKLVLEKTVNENSMQIRLTEFASGMYHIQLFNNGNVVQERLIIRHSDR